MHKRKVICIYSAVVFALLIAGYGLFRISKSRTFQFFGEIVSRVETSEKVVALTFDDGPTEYVTDVLNTLKKKDVKATFFLIGRELEKNPQFGKDIVLSGHELGNHTYSHQRMWFKSPAFVASEIEKSNELIQAAGYQGQIHFRPPYGKKLFILPWYLQQHDTKTVMWDLEPDSYGSGADFIEKYTLENTKPGSIVLLHPLCKACSGQREALGRIIDGLRAQGYQFVTVSELLAYENK